MRGAPLAVEQRAARQLELGPQVVQVPLQRVVERAARADQPLAMVDQQPNVELRAGQLGRRQRLDALGQRGPCDGERVDRSDLPRSRLDRRELAISRVGTRTTRSPRAIREPLEGARDMPAVLQRPDALRRPAPEPTAAPRRTRASRPWRSCRRASRPSPRRQPAIVCELLCMSAPSTIISRVPFFSRLKWTAGGHGLLRALPRSFQVTPDIPDRRRATQQKEVRPTGSTASKRVSSPPVGTISAASDVTDSPNHNSKPQSSIRTAEAQRTGSPRRDRRAERRRRQRRGRGSPNGSPVSRSRILWPVTWMTCPAPRRS